MGLERHFLEHMADICPFVQILDAPVPQRVENVTDTLRILDLPIAEQVIVVPKISCSPCPSRSLVPEPQLADQLVEVPTVLSPLRIAEQIVGIPVPRGRGKRRVQGFLSEQSSTATSSSLERISERTVEQIVDISPGGGLGQGLASSAGVADEDFYFFALFPMDKSAECRAGGECAALGGHVSSSTLRRPDEDFTGWGGGGFRTFPQILKNAKLASHSSPRVPASVSPSTPAAQLEDAPLPDSSSGCRSGNATLARLTTGTDVLTVQSGRHQLVSRSCGSAKGMRRNWSGTGTGTRVSLCLTSLLFLLGEVLTASPGRYTTTGRRAVFAVSRSSSP